MGASSMAMGGGGAWNRTETSFDTPGSCIVTPYSACAASMVRLECVMTMNCVCADISADQPCQAHDVRLVQRRVHFVQDAERAGLVLEDRHQQRHRGQRLLAAREQQHVLQLLARRRRNDIDAGLGQVLLIGQAHLAGAAAEQRLEHLAEVGVDGLERLGELLRLGSIS